MDTMELDKSMDREVANAMREGIREERPDLSAEEMDALMQSFAKRLRGEGIYVHHLDGVGLTDAERASIESAEKALEDVRRFGPPRLERVSVWSIEVADMSAVAFRGTGVVLEYDSYWPGGSIDTPDPRTLGVRLVTDLPDNPTWEDLYEAADRLIAVSGDHHHRFIEHFERNGNQIKLETGS